MKCVMDNNDKPITDILSAKYCGSLKLVSFVQLKNKNNTATGVKLFAILHQAWILKANT